MVVSCCVGSFWGWSKHINGLLKTFPLNKKIKKTMASTSSKMDMGGTETTKKRTIQVDPDDGTEIVSSKKSRATPDTEMKVKCLKFILNSYEKIHDLNDLPSKDPLFLNITTACNILNTIFSVFNMQRQLARQRESNSAKKAKVTKYFTVMCGGTHLNMGVPEVTTIVVEEAKKLGLEFKDFSKGDKADWYGTASPYLDFFASFTLTVKELRIGHANMPCSKTGDLTKSFPVSKYGLNDAHHILLEGCTYPPEKRSSMAQSLGPMTTFLLHVRTEDTYREKWTRATKKAMAHVPYIDEVLGVCKNKKATEIAGIISLLADISSGRQANRMAFPINFLYRAYKLPTAEGKILSNENKPTELKGGEEILNSFNVSGLGGYYLYKLCSFMSFELDGQLTPAQAAQVTFHGIFGTYKEDLSVLATITDCGSWYTREDLGNAFVNSSSCGMTAAFNPVKLNYYAKLSTANQTGMLTSNYGQTSSIPVFSGQRKQHFSEEFFEQLGRRTGALTVSKTIPQLTAALVQVLGLLNDDLIKNGKVWEMGTVSWRKMDDLNADNPEELVCLVVEATGKFFLGRSK